MAATETVPDVGTKAEGANASRLTRIVSDLCRVRLAELMPPRDVDRVRAYLLKLIEDRARPPRRQRKFAFDQISRASGVAIPPKAMVPISLALDAIGGEARPAGTDEGPSARPKAQRQHARKPSPEPSQQPVAHTARPRRGRKPRPFVDNPVPLWDPLLDPPGFAEALKMQMARHGDTLVTTRQAVVNAGISLGEWTIAGWTQGKRAPRSISSMRALKALEARYGLPDGYFKQRFPHQTRAAHGHHPHGIGEAERRRLAWRLPDDFDLRPAAEQEAIIEWVRTHIVSGSTDYRRFQAIAVKQRYALRFDFDEEVAELTDDDPDLSMQDPESTPGIRRAPALLQAEVRGLLAFKTATLAPTGLARSGVWGEVTAAQKLEHLGLLFGALAASREGVRGFGVPSGSLCLALFVVPAVWDWYIQWRERRRGFYTAWEADMLALGIALTRAETGWMRQNPDLAANLKPIPGLVTQADVDLARTDWDGACDRLYKHASSRVKEVQKVAKVHRDPFEPILPVLEADRPLAEYRKITDEIARRIPDEGRYPISAAEAVRSFLLLRLGMHLGVRQKNIRQLLFRGRAAVPLSERALSDRRCGEFRWSERDRGWEVVIPAGAFKNAASSFFGGKPFRLVLPDMAGLYGMIDAYVHRHRLVLRGDAADPETFFVKTAKSSSTEVAYNQTTFYEAWRLAIQRYGIHNPFTGRGVIAGLLPHGPHSVRDILATHVLKVTGSFEQASYAIQDTPDTVAQHYGRFLPQDKAALAAKILNEVWRDADRDEGS